MIPSILIVRSALALKFVDDKVAGIEVPPELIARAEAAADQQHECFEIACELADHARSLPGVAGLHFISFRKDAGIAKLCQRLGIKPRAERDQPHGNSPALAV
jgi:methylenetetrahydrofolate reductase (NADPH)